MGFFNFPEEPRAATELKGFSIDLLHRKQCGVCPLNHQRELHNPQMLPSGTGKPIVYMLGDSPTKVDDLRDEQMVGEIGNVLRMRIPSDWKDALRWNYIVRTRSLSRGVGMVETECCRPSIIADIEATKPIAIFGFGPLVLDWALKESRITTWSGRHAPVKIGNHTCWFVPVIHPQFIHEGRKSRPRNDREYGSEMEFAFATHIRDAFSIVESLPRPSVMTREEALADISYVTGAGGVRDVDKVLEWLDLCWDDPHVGMDYETNGLRPYKKGAKILSAALSIEKGSFAFPFHHRQSKWSDSNLLTVRKAFKDFLLRAPCTKISHNLAFEQEWSAFFFGRDVVLDGSWEDTQSQAYILDERQNSNSLDFLAVQYFGLRIKEIDNLDRKNIDGEELEKVLRYNGMDAKFHRLLHHKQIARLKAEGMLPVYRQHMRRVPTMVLTQLKGVPVNQKIARDFFDKYRRRLDLIEDDIFDLPIVQQFKKKFKAEFRPSANDDTKNALRYIAGLQVEKVDEKALKNVKHPLAKLVLKWRKAAKLLGTYVLPLIDAESAKTRGVEPSQLLYPDGLLHPVIGTTKVRTWRTSSEDPNIQNWPAHGDGKEIRKAVNPGGDMRVVSIDYAGIQGRNVAMESLDPNLMEKFWNNYDIHTDWKERILKRYPQWMTKADLADKVKQKAFRQTAKNKFVFPSFFGAQPRTLAAGCSIPEDKAALVLEEFFDEFPVIKKWHGILEKQFFRDGYVTGLSGFRRHAPVSMNELINSPIQSDESIIVCGAMERLSITGDPKFQANWMVHDDLTFIWHKNEIERNMEVAVKAMLEIEFDWINVPLEVEVKVGLDWCTMETIGEFENRLDGKVVEIRK